MTRLLLLSCLVCLFQGACGQYFKFDNEFLFHPSCGLEDGAGTWNISGRLFMDPVNSYAFEDKIVFKTGQHVICEADISNCKPREPTETDGCFCTKKLSTQLLFEIVRVARVEESEKPLIATLPLRNGCFITELKAFMGLMPPVYKDREIVYGSYQIDGGPEQVLQHNQTVGVCGGHYVDFKVCVFNLIPEFLITLENTATGRTTTTMSDCLSVTRVFNFTTIPWQPQRISYTEDSWCPRQGEFFINFEQTEEECSEDKCPTKTHHASCESHEGALPRHVATLTDSGVTTLCDTETDGGNWKIIQRRVSGDTDFYQNFTMYQEGFGDLTGDFWLGLHNIHALCYTDACQLRVDLKFNGTAKYATYDYFTVAGHGHGYKLKVHDYHGTAGDSLSFHNNMEFTTKDHDKDTNSNNCAVLNHGAWWYGNCHNSNLNGMWGVADFGNGMVWTTYTGMENSVTFSEMKVRIAAGAV